jgi:hypothetical protein
VRKACDLPSRLLLGELSEESFSRDGNGWQARYEGTSSCLDLRWNQQGFQAAQQWHGHEAVTRIGNGAFASLAQVGLVHRRWLREVSTSLDPPVNVFVESGADVPTKILYYPDGLLLTLVLPVAFRDLMDCVYFLQHLADEPRIIAPVSAALQRNWSVVNYIQPDSPEQQRSPDATDLCALRVFGLPPVEPAKVETRGDGVQALTLRRQHYQLTMDLFFGDLSEVLLQLARHGLIAERTKSGESVAEQHPDAPEYSAVVLPAVIGPFVKQLVFFDDARTRRVVYPRPILGIDQRLPPVDEAAPRAMRQIEDLQALIRGRL